MEKWDQEDGPPCQLQGPSVIFSVGGLAAVLCGRISEPVHRRGLGTLQPFQFIPVRNGRGRFDVARALPQTLPSDSLLLNLLGDKSSPGAGDRSRGLW